MIAKQLDMMQRMRASLLCIVDLDPESVSTRIVETDWEIDRLNALLELGRAATPSRAAGSGTVEIAPIGLGLRAA